MLVHHADVELCGLVRRMDAHLLPADVDFALVGLVHAEQHAHQRAFPRAVFAEQRVNLALAHGNAHVVVCHDGAEALRDVAHFNDIVFLLHLVSSIPPGKRQAPRKAIPHWTASGRPHLLCGCCRCDETSAVSPQRAASLFAAGPGPRRPRHTALRSRLLILPNAYTANPL